MLLRLNSYYNIRYIPNKMNYFRINYVTYIIGHFITFLIIRAQME